MELFFEIVFILTLLGGSLYFIFDIKDILAKLASVIIFLCVLIFFGFFFGMGIHVANTTFGW